MYTYIFFTAVNNTPWMDVNGNAYSTENNVVFTEQGGPVSIVDPAGFVMDIGNFTVAYMIVQTSSEYLQASALLVYYQPYLSNGQVIMATSVINITANIWYDASSAALRVSGLPSMEQYDMVLRSITYNNLKEQTGPV